MNDKILVVVVSGSRYFSVTAALVELFALRVLLLVLCLIDDVTSGVARISV